MKPGVSGETPRPRGRGRRLNLRILAARAVLLLGGRRREIERLFARTAAAFGCLVPPAQGRGAQGLLSEYARFTRAQADAALDGGADLQALDRRLFDAAYRLGTRYRLRLGVTTRGDAMSAARLIYGGLGIDFRAGLDGDVHVRRCAFAHVYTPRVCALVSALDRGLLAGLTKGGELHFRQRLTEGAPTCSACLTGGMV